MTSSRTRSTGSPPEQRERFEPVLRRPDAGGPRARAGARGARDSPRRRRRPGSSPAPWRPRARRARRPAPAARGAAGSRRARRPRAAQAAARPASAACDSAARCAARRRRRVGAVPAPPAARAVDGLAEPRERRRQRGRETAEVRRALARRAPAASDSSTTARSAAPSPRTRREPPRARRRRRVLEQHLAVADDVVERRAQLVPQVRERCRSVFTACHRVRGAPRSSRGAGRARSAWCRSRRSPPPSAFSRSPAMACAVSAMTGIARVAGSALSSPRRLPAVEHRQAHVHQDQVRRLRPRHVDALLRRRRRSRPRSRACASRRESMSRFISLSSTSRIFAIVRLVRCAGGAARGGPTRHEVAHLAEQRLAARARPSGGPAPRSR